MGGKHRVVAQQHHRGLPEAGGLSEEAVRLDEAREGAVAVASFGEAADLLGLAERLPQHRGLGRESRADCGIVDIRHVDRPVYAAGIGAR